MTIIEKTIAEKDDPNRRPGSPFTSEVCEAPRVFATSEQRLGAMTVRAGSIDDHMVDMPPSGGRVRLSRAWEIGLEFAVRRNESRLSDYSRTAIEATVRGEVRGTLVGPADPRKRMTLSEAPEKATRRGVIPMVYIESGPPPKAPTFFEMTPSALIEPQERDPNYPY